MARQGLSPKQTNKSCWNQAQKVLVGGVNSPVRSFKSVGMTPFFVDRGQGPYLWDVEGKRYLDYVSSWGALILGHRAPSVMTAAKQALQKGTTFGTPTPKETQLAEAIIERVPSVEKVRFVSSGTEAVMSAIRLARGATQRNKVLKFDSGYHGHSDALLAKAGSGLATLGLPASPGVPKSVTQDTLTIPFNDVKAFEKIMRKVGHQVACVLVEPIQANMGVIPPAPGFLKCLRSWTTKKKALLIFDEVITGFRVGPGGAQKRLGVRPDLTTFGKIIGGGFPVGAYGGPKKLMQQVAPEGAVYQAGTLAGHPVAMAAGLATLKALTPSVYQRIEKTAQTLKKGLMDTAKQANVPMAVHQIGGLLCLFFSKGPICNGDDVSASDTAYYKRYFKSMLEKGVYLPPSPYEAWFISAAVGPKEIKQTIKAHQQTLEELR